MNAVPRPEFDQAFFKALLGEDELGVVVRAHIHVEASLNEFIEAVIPFPERAPNLRYQQRIQLACAFGLKEEHAPALKILGELRNAFAHKLNTALTMESVRRLYNALSPTAREGTELAYRNTKSQVLTEKGPDLLSLEPRDLFILIAVSLKGMLMVAVHEARSQAQEP
jgi:hypothetical protein